MVTAAVLVLALVRAGLGLGSPSPGCGTELDLAPGLSHRVTVTLADPLQGGHSVCRGVSSDLLLKITLHHQDLAVVAKFCHIFRRFY